MADFKMPSLGADMEAGTLVEWMIKPGDRVKRGDVVAIVETDKGNIDIEIWQDGVVEQLVVAPETKVPVGTVLATLRTEEKAEETMAPAAPPPPAPAPIPAVATGGASSHVRATPAARKLAREKGLDLARLNGSGPMGAITHDDVERAGKGPPAVVSPPVTVPTIVPAVVPTIAPKDGMRRAIAAAMARSNREIPHYYVATEIDVSRLQAWIQQQNAGRLPADRLLIAAPLVRAVALALRQWPELNGFYDDSGFHASEAIHIGFAISLRQGGLVAPALHDVDKKSPAEIMMMLRDLLGRARSGSLRSSEMTDPTITVTSLGERGVETVFGVIYPPQVALVGLGKIVEKPWAAGGMLGIRPVVTATLAADHRVSDGHRGALFLAHLAELIAEPEKL